MPMTEAEPDRLAVPPLNRLLPLTQGCSNIVPSAWLLVWIAACVIHTSLSVLCTPRGECLS